MVARIQVTGIADAFRDAEAELIDLANQLTRSQLLLAITALREVTPIDTGRARASWDISEGRPIFADTGVRAARSGGLLASSALSPIQTGQVVDFYITNGVPYIADLNQGRSRQAPRRFIERTLLRFFDPDGIIVQVRGAL